MKNNPFAYVLSGLFVLLAHLAMLANIVYNGNYAQLSDVWTLAGTVLGLDLAWFIIMPFFRQHSHTVDFILILILNMSLIFQSCFGEVHLALKHMITCIAALIASRIGFFLCRDHNWIAKQKKFVWIGIGVVMVIILLFTGSRSMWINFGSFTIQPSELLKPLLVMACATSVAEQQKKHKLLWFNVVWENLILLGITAAICLLQWWCRDLGSIPTFAAIYAAGFLMRICYPKAKFSKKTLIGAGIAVLAIAGIGIKLAPAYVRDRLFVDIWSDKTGNGYQQSQALIAIADGGWFGKGPGKGFLHNVFAYESDIVFSTISEEWGLLFALMVIFIILLMLAIPLINPARSYYHGTLAAGVCAAFTVQMALNIFGSCNMIPFTGVTIPFISMGGTSMVTSGLMAGMLIASQSPEFGKLPTKKAPAKKKKPASRPAVRKGAQA